MAIRWRKNGELICAAKSLAFPGDTYIDDRMHYELSVNQKCLVADRNHETNGLHHWLHAGGNPKAGVFIRTEN